MPKEIERKFLVKDPSVIEGLAGVKVIQGYLSEGPVITRVRIIDDSQAFLTLKDAPQGLTRNEYEYRIPLQDGYELISRAADPTGGGLIEKIRYRITQGDWVFEVDVFQGQLRGLVTVEVELQDEADAPTLPPWVGEEISYDPTFSNAALAKGSRATAGSSVLSQLPNIHTSRL